MPALLSLERTLGVAGGAAVAAAVLEAALGEGGAEADVDAAGFGAALLDAGFRAAVDGRAVCETE